MSDSEVIFRNVGKYQSINGTYLNIAVDDDICNGNNLSEDWEFEYKTGLCLFNKNSAVNDGLKCESDFRVLGCHGTYHILEEVRKTYYFLNLIFSYLSHLSGEALTTCPLLHRNKKKETDTDTEMGNQSIPVK